MSEEYPFLPELERIAHELAERAGWEARHAMIEDYTAEEVQKHWIYTARVHHGISFAARNENDAAEWNNVQLRLMNSRCDVSDSPCTNCGTTNDVMREAHTRARYYNLVRYPDRPMYGEFAPRPGVILPDGTYFCWVCSWDAAYKWLADPLLSDNQLLLPALWRETEADYQNHKGDPSYDDRDRDRDVDEFPEFDADRAPGERPAPGPGPGPDA